MNNSPLNQQRRRIFDKLKVILSDLSGNNSEEIYYDSELERGLNFNFETDLQDIIDAVNEEFFDDRQLDRDTILSDLNTNGQTVGRLVEIIELEIELG